MAMAINLAPKKFTFDLDMGQTAEPAGQSPMISAEAAAILAENARREGYEQGISDGRGDAAAQAARALADAAERLNGYAAHLLDAADAMRQDLLNDAVQLAASVGRKLAAHLIARQPTAEIEALLRECFASLDAVPHLVVRCHPELAEAVRGIADGQMAVSGFAGRLVVMGEPEHALGDCRIEWVDGGLARDVQAISQDIDNRILSYLSAGKANAAGPHHGPDTKDLSDEQ